MRINLSALAASALALTGLASAQAPQNPAVLSTGPAAVALSTVPVRPALRLLAMEEIPAFVDSFKSRAGLAKAARKTLDYLSGQTTHYFRIGDRQYAKGVLVDGLEELLVLLKNDPSPEELARAVKERFDVFESIGSDGMGKVVFTSYYQPILEASLKKTPKYRYPLYRRPPDMIEADLGAFDKKYAGETLIGRVDKNKRFVPFFNRDQIDNHGGLGPAGAPGESAVAWLKDRFDVLDLHIQGSGILKLPDGRSMLARYAATNAWPYASVGLVLVKAGVFSREEISHDRIRQYFKAHPEAQDWVIAQNPRYTFFQIVPLPEDGEPFGTINQSLVSARSIAIDPAVIPLGALAFFTTTSPQADKEGRLLGQFANARFAVCMDTGGAIKGPGRVDIYAGHGKQADTTARYQWSDGRLYILIKKIPPRER